jgi:hypothetical protein
MGRIILIGFVFLLSLNIAFAMQNENTDYEMNFFIGDNGHSREFGGDIALESGIGQGIIGNETADDINAQFGVYYADSVNLVTTTTTSATTPTTTTTLMNDGIVEFDISTIFISRVNQSDFGGLALRIFQNLTLFWNKTTGNWTLQE